MSLHRNEIRTAVQDKLAELGFSRAVVSWGDRPAELKVLVGSSIKVLKIKSGMSNRRLKMELDLLEAWAGQRDDERARSTYLRDVSQVDLEDVIPRSAVAFQDLENANG